MTSIMKGWTSGGACGRGRICDIRFFFLQAEDGMRALTVTGVQTCALPISPDLQVLLLERADHPGFWQSVTGSKDAVDEPLIETVHREVAEETGLNARQYPLTDWGYSKDRKSVV